MAWPIGMGNMLKGVYDLIGDRVLLFEAGRGDHIQDAIAVKLDEPRLDELVGADAAAKLREEVALVRGACPPFDLDSFLAGHLTPVFFGAALRNFGVRELLAGIARLAPPPGPRPAEQRAVQPSEKKVTGFVFKIQANMDPNHRDRIAFMRLCSGQFERGMKLMHPRSGKPITVSSPLFFLARDRAVVDEAFPGDIIARAQSRQPAHRRLFDRRRDPALHRHSQFRAEILRRVRLDDPMKSKQLRRALESLAEEGVSRLFKPLSGSAWIVGVVGPLQFDVIAHRIQSEYNLKGGIRRRALRDGALDLGREGGHREILLRQRQQHGRGPRRRPGLPGPQRLDPATRPGRLPGGEVRRRA